MACIRGEAVLDRPVEEVFAVLADPATSLATTR
jgi:hypothetical protein